MDWMNVLNSSGEPESAAPLDETVINGAPYDPTRMAQKAIPAVGLGGEISEEKRAASAAEN